MVLIKTREIPHPLQGGERFSLSMDPMISILGQGAVQEAIEVQTKEQKSLSTLHTDSQDPGTLLYP